MNIGAAVPSVLTTPRRRGRARSLENPESAPAPPASTSSASTSVRLRRHEELGGRGRGGVRQLRQALETGVRHTVGVSWVKPPTHHLPLTPRLGVRPCAQLAELQQEPEAPPAWGNAAASVAATLEAPASASSGPAALPSLAQIRSEELARQRTAPTLAGMVASHSPAAVCCTT